MAIPSARSLAIVLGAVVLSSVATAWAFAQPGTPAGPSAPARVFRMGSIDLVVLAREQLTQPEQTAARDELQAKFEARMAPIRQRLQSQQAALQQFTSPSQPGAQQAVQQLQALRQAFERVQQETSVEFNTLTARQLIEARRQTTAAARAVAAREGYTHVIASSDRGLEDLAPLETVGFAEAREILQAQTLVVSPAADDLTALVRAELGLPEPTEATEAGEAAETGETGDQAPSSAAEDEDEPAEGEHSADDTEDE